MAGVATGLLNVSRFELTLIPLPDSDQRVFLAATKQLYEWFSPSVRPSVCPSHLFDYVPIIVSS